jgi:hypothetical protein
MLQPHGGEKFRPAFCDNESMFRGMVLWLVWACGLLAQPTFHEDETLTG